MNKCLKSIVLTAFCFREEEIKIVQVTRAANCKLIWKVLDILKHTRTTIRDLNKLPMIQIKVAQILNIVSKLNNKINLSTCYSYGTVKMQAQPSRLKPSRKVTHSMNTYNKLRILVLMYSSLEGLLRIKSSNEETFSSLMTSLISRKDWEVKSPNNKNTKK